MQSKQTRTRGRYDPNHSLISYFPPNSPDSGTFLELGIPPFTLREALVGCELGSGWAKVKAHRRLCGVGAEIGVRDSGACLQTLTFNTDPASGSFQDKNQKVSTQPNAPQEAEGGDDR